MSPVKKRKMEMEESYGEVNLAFERFSQCGLKLQELLKLLVADSDYELSTGKLPPHIAEESKKKKGTVSRGMRCGFELRLKLEKYEKLSQVSEGPQAERKSVLGKHQKLNKVTSDASKEVAVVCTGNEQDSSKDSLKSLELELVHDISKHWKETIDDVSSYMQHVKTHRFCKPSCRLRLGRAILMLRFIRGFVEETVSGAEQKEVQLEENIRIVARLQDSTNHLNQKLAAEKKLSVSMQRKAGKFKQQLESETKKNQALMNQIVEIKENMESTASEEVAEEPPPPLQQELPPEQETSLHEDQLQQLQSEQRVYEETVQKLKLLESGLAESEKKAAEIRAQAEEYKKERDLLKNLLEEMKEENSSLTENAAFLKETASGSITRITELKKKVVEQEDSLLSMRLTMNHKDTVIRGLKQAAIEHKSNEGKRRRAPSQPPPSPEEERPETSPKRSESMQGRVKEKEQDKTEKEEKEQEPDVMKVEEPNDQEMQREQAQPEADIESAGDISPATKHVGTLEKPRPGKNLYQGRKKKSSVSKEPNIQKKLNIPKKSSIQRDPKVAPVSQDLKKLKKAHENKVQELKNAENDMKNLCFTVKDETKRIQKGMKQFSEGLDHELNLMLGSKNMAPYDNSRKPGNSTHFNSVHGRAKEARASNDAGRVPGSLLNNFNFSLGGAKNRVPSLGGGQDVRGMALMSQITSQKRGTMYDLFTSQEDMLEMEYNSNVGGEMKMEYSDSEERNDNVRNSKINYHHRKSRGRTTLDNFGLEPQEMQKCADSATSGISILDPSAGTPPSTRRQAQDGVPRSVISDEGIRFSRQSRTTSGEQSANNRYEYTAKKDDDQELEDGEGEPVEVALNAVDSPIPQSKYGPNVTVFSDNKSVAGMIMERKRARLGEKSRSAVIPFRSPAIYVEARGEAIFEPVLPEKSTVEYNTSVKKKVEFSDSENPEPKVREPPAIQAEKYVRVMSKQFESFLQDLNDKLVTILRNSRQQMEEKMRQMEDNLFRSKMKHRAEIASINIEKSALERKLKRFTKDGSNLGDENTLYQDLVYGLKAAENELDEAKKRLDKAARRHEVHADQYRNVAKTLECQLEEKGRENAQLERIVQKETMTSNELRLQLRNVLKSQRQVLFLSYQEHVDNYGQIERSEDVDINVQKVALSLLRRSMLYPEESLRLLILHYCQHVKFTVCQERVRKCVVEREKISSQNMMNGKYAVDKNTMLTNLLAGLEVRKELARQRIAEKRKRLDDDRQKILVKMAFVMQKLSNDNKDLYLFQPTVLKVYKRPCLHSRHNTPVPRERLDRQFYNTKCQHNHLPEIGSETSIKQAKPSNAGGDLSMKGSKLSTNLQSLKAAVPHWFPADSLSCPFSIISDNKNSTHSSASSYQNRNSSLRVDVPRIMQLEIQSGFRQARKNVLKRLCNSRHSANQLSFAPSLNSHHEKNLSTAFANLYHKASGQNQSLHTKSVKSMDSVEQCQTETDVSTPTSQYSIFSPWPPLSAPASSIIEQRKSTPSDSFALSGSAYELTESGASSNIGTRSSTTTTPGFPN